MVQQGKLPLFEMPTSHIRVLLYDLATLPLIWLLRKAAEDAPSTCAFQPILHVYYYKMAMRIGWAHICDHLNTFFHNAFSCLTWQLSEWSF